MKSGNINKISGWQLLVLVYIMISSKIFVIPHVMIADSKRDLWLAAGISLVLAFAAMTAVLIASRLAPDLSATELISKLTGKIAAKIIVGLFCVIILISLTVNIYDFVFQFAERQFVYVPRGLFSFLVVAIIGYMARRGIQNIARCGEILFPFLMLLLIFMVIKVGISAEYQRLLPMGRSGKIFGSIFKYPALFADALLPVLMLGRIKKDSANLKFGIIGFTVGAAVIMIFCVGFTTLFSNIESVSRYAFSVSDVVYSGQVNRSDTSIIASISVLFWIIVLLVKNAAITELLSENVAEIFGIGKRIYVEVSILAAIFIVSGFVIEDREVWYTFILGKYSYAAFIFLYCLPLLLPFCSLRSRRLYNGA